MCTYQTNLIDVQASAKGPKGWIKATQASIYFDHPVHAPSTHSLNIDFLDLTSGPQGRVALELSADSARKIATTILDLLETNSHLVEPEVK